ncbi:hypothetical protein SAMN05216533_3362 [Streptomyces sp. Ag109_O5-10]|nr:hypothetical protein SAMN05216533_3362 [Streptomyces sp. Ag109_O5-10]
MKRWYGAGCATSSSCAAATTRLSVPDLFCRDLLARVIFTEQLCFPALTGGNFRP